LGADFDLKTKSGLSREIKQAARFAAALSP
jgi:hypothetical protein